VKDPLQALIEAGAVPSASFPPSSRYSDVGTALLPSGDGTPETPYLRRRFAPKPELLSTMQEHTVVEGDRLDMLAGRYLGDAELYWRLCDANGAIWPDELIDPAGFAEDESHVGRQAHRLRIALPRGVPGAYSD
jgi:hypothetical protein